VRPTPWLLLALAGCPDRTISELTPVQVGEVQKDIPVSADIDILFVIDNSGSTKDKQTVFSQNFPRFVEALDRFPTGRPNVHLGVVTSTVDLGVSLGGCPHPAPNDNGLLQNKPRVASCMPPNGRYISDVALPGGGRQTNYAASQSLAQTLSCIAQVGSDGCGFEAPLEAMKRALDGTRPENTGFIRSGAFLAVVFLVDEDDASIEDPAILSLPPRPPPNDFRAQPQFAYSCDQTISGTTGGNYTNCRPRTGSYLRDPAAYYQFVSTLKPPGRTVVALIGGDPTRDIATGALTDPIAQPLALLGSCDATINGQYAIGRPAIRLMDFVSRFSGRGLFRSVCQSDYSQTLDDIGQLLFNAISPCLEGTLDTDDIDPANPGLQLDCNVSDVQNPDSAEPIETPMPACDMTDPSTPAASGASCYWIKPSPGACATTTGLEINFARTAPPAPGTSVRVRCATHGE
jgi:hypothetical protein